MWKVYGLAETQGKSIFQPESKLFFASGAIALGLIWWAKTFLGIIEIPWEPIQVKKNTFFLSFTSLLILSVGYLLLIMISIDNIVQTKYNAIMDSLVYDEGKYIGDPRQNLQTQWVRLSITTSRLAEVAGTSKKTRPHNSN